MRRKKHQGLCSHQQRRDKTSQGARYGGEERARRTGNEERRERKEAETANLPGAFWELNLAGEISGVRTK